MQQRQPLTPMGGMSSETVPPPGASPASSPAAGHGGRGGWWLDLMFSSAVLQPWERTPQESPSLQPPTPTPPPRASCSHKCGVTATVRCVEGPRERSDPQCPARVGGCQTHRRPSVGIAECWFRARDYLLRVYSSSGCLPQAGRGAKPALSVAKPTELAKTVPAHKSLVRTSQGRVNTRTG